MWKDHKNKSKQVNLVALNSSCVQVQNEEAYSLAGRAYPEEILMNEDLKKFVLSYGRKFCKEKSISEVIEEIILGVAYNFKLLDIEPKRNRYSFNAKKLSDYCI